MAEIKAYEVTLAGFDAGTDETDHLVVWLSAETAEDVEKLLEGTGARFWGEIPYSEDDIDHHLPADQAEFIDRLRGAAPAPTP